MNSSFLPEEELKHQELEPLHDERSYVSQSRQPTAGLPCSGGTNSSFFEAQEDVEDTIEGISRRFNQAKTLIEQKRTYCKIKARVNFILQNGKDPFEVIYQLIKPNLRFIINANYQLDVEEFQGLKLALSRVEQYLDDKDKLFFTERLETKGVGFDKSNSAILANAHQQARSLKYALDRGAKPSPPKQILSKQEMRSLVNLFHSPEVTGNDATAMLYELFRIMHVVNGERQGQDFLEEFWHSDHNTFFEFILHNLEWCLHKSGDVLQNIKEAAAVLHQMLPRLGQSLNGDNQETRVMLLQRSVRHFRIKLASQGFLDQSDALYEVWKDFKEAQGEEIPIQPVHFRERSRVLQEPRRPGRGRGRGRDCDLFEDGENSFNRGSRGSRAAYSRGSRPRGQYRGFRGERRGNRGYLRNSGEPPRPEMSPQNIASSPVPNFVAPPGWNEEPSQVRTNPLQEFKEEDGEIRQAQDIFNDNESVNSYPSYQKEILDINQPRVQDCEWGQPPKQIDDPVAPPPPSAPSKPKHFLNVEEENQNKLPSIESDQMDELPRPSQEPNLQEINVDLKKQDEEEKKIKEQEKKIEVLEQTVPSSLLEIERSFYLNLQKQEYQAEDRKISEFIAQTAKCFKCRDNERTSILRKIKHMNMALKIDKIFFKKYPAQVRPFGSFCNGGWTSGAEQVNVGILFKNLEHCKEHTLQTVCINMKRVLQKSLQCKIIQIEWSAGPALLMTVTDPATRKTINFQIAILPYGQVHTSQMLFDYALLDIRCEQLFTFLRKWLDVKAPSGRIQEMCPPYVLELMLVSFLQTRNPPILPNLQEAKKEEKVIEIKVLQNKEEVIIPIDIYHYTPVLAEESAQTLLNQQQGQAVNKNEATLGSLLYEFLHFYLYKFNREKWVVNPARGGYSTKQEPNENMFCVKDPFYSHARYVLRGKRGMIKAGSENWDTLFKSLEGTVKCFEEKNPILSLEETDTLKAMKKDCWSD